MSEPSRRFGRFWAWLNAWSLFCFCIHLIFKGFVEDFVVTQKLARFLLGWFS